ncbi:calcium-binding protein, partial [Crocosphaera sp.]|uniref:calcium-binding protein n=1 Tax=Crocosphaera sp. TaxID=2729996 RepID=UPI00338E2D90
MLASIEDNILWLNMGPRATIKNYPDVGDIAEAFTVWTDDQGLTWVAAFGLTSSFENNSYTELRADGGEDNDRIYIDAQITNLIKGGMGNDVIMGGVGDDNFEGNSGSDVLVGGEGNDTLSGGDDQDKLEGGMGNDFLKGEEADDTLLGEDGDDTLLGGDGNDNLAGNKDDDFLSGESGNDSLDGGEGNDKLWGGEGEDTIHGQSGEDELEGNLGDDVLYGQTGNDQLKGDQGEDILFGGTDNDNLDGGSENDFLFGEQGQDTLSGGDGNDNLIGGTEEDHLYGDQGEDYLEGNEADDLLEGGTGDDYLQGNEGNDTLSGGMDNDLLEGGIGNDRLYGDGGNDELYGDEGDDTIEGGTEDDTLIGDIGNDSLRGDQGEDSLEGNAGEDTLYGGTGNDTLIGGEESDRLYGDGGNDELYGDEGDDTIEEGNADHDSLFGNDGNDTIYAGTGNDYIEAGSENDTVYASFGNDTLYGNEGDDYLDAGDSNDSLFGASDDSLFGGTGNDTLLPGWGADNVDGGEDTDTLIIDYSTLPTAAILWSPSLTSPTATVSNAYGMTDPIVNYDVRSRGNVGSISANGTTIAALFPGSDFGIQKLERENPPLLVRSFNTSSIDISFSTDGNKLVYRKREGSGISENLYVSNWDNTDNIHILNGTEEKTAIRELLGREYFDNEGLGISDLMMSGDGTKVAWISTFSYHNDSHGFETVHYISVINSDGTGLVRSPFSTSPPSNLFISEDGSKVAWYDRNLESVEIANHDFSEVKTLGNNAFGGFDLSADGSEIAWYDYNRSTFSGTLSIASVDDLSNTKIDIFSADVNTLNLIELSSDGNQISFSHYDYDNGQPNLYTVKSDGTEPPILISSGGNYIPFGKFSPRLSGYVDIGVRYDSFDVDTGSGEIVTWGPSHVNFTNVEKFDLTGTIYGDELLGGNLEDTLTGNGGADTLKGGLGDDIYQLDSRTNGGTYIEDTAGNDTLIIDNLELSLQLPTTGIGGIQRDKYNLIIDVNADGIINSEEDVTLVDFFAETSGITPGTGFIETVDNLDGNDILNFLSHNGNNFLETGNGDGELYGGIGDDTLQGNDKNDTLYGEAGNDRLNPGWGEDMVDGGEDTDTLVLDYSTLPTAAVIWNDSSD